MKTMKLKLIMLLIVLFTCGGFTAMNKEEEARQLNSSIVIVPDKCFTGFMKNMNALGAVYYIPEDKLAKGKEFGLTQVTVGNQTGAFEFNSFFDQVRPVEKPGDDCSKSLSLNFSDLGLVVFVDKKKSVQYPKSGIQKMEFKFRNISYKLEGKFMTNQPLELKLDNKTTVKMIPVEWKDAER